MQSFGKFEQGVAVSRQIQAAKTKDCSMKLRWVCFLSCAAVGVAALACGLLVPAHLRALDAGVLQLARRGGPLLLEQGGTLAGEKKLGAAQILMAAARATGMPGWDRLGTTVTNLSQQNPAALFWGDDARAEKIFGNDFSPADQNLDFTDFIIRRENREAALAHLQDSSVQAVQELLRSRSLNNTALFSPSASPAGQAFDAAVCVCGLLLDGNRLTPDLSREISGLATKANQGGDTNPLEQMLMDFLSLGQRFNWDQLTTFVAQVPDAATLHRLADNARGAGDNLPVLFAAVQLSGKPAAVADYLARFPGTGFADLGAALHFGAGGIGELAQRQQRFYDPATERHLLAFNPFGPFFFFAANYCLHQPALALAAKWFLYLLAGFLAASSVHFALPAVSLLERPLQVRGFHLMREFLFSLAFLFVVLLLSEPFLAQESQKGNNLSLRLVLSTVGGTVPPGIANIKQNVMNPTIMLTLLVFFVLQALLYISCLVKLAEIRRQNVPPRMKLKLLENEDHLFDAGLYLGFVGTIVSLILASMGMVKFSLMAAYSSTSFGIVFVVIFKIFHLRPTRRKLLLEAELAETGAIAARTTTIPVRP
jgi:hypothetical protein